MQNKMEKELFKAVLGEVMKIEYEKMSPTDVTVIALGALSAFARQNGITLSCNVKQEDRAICVKQAVC